MNIYMETYGCSANLSESEIIEGLLQKNGFDIVKTIGSADLIIINSCVVKEATEQRLLYNLQKIKKEYPNKKLIIAGCAPEVIKEKLKSVAPEASLVSTHHIIKIPEIIKQIFDGKKIEMIGKENEIKVCLPRARKNPIVNITKISEGCNSCCAYCCVKLAKGGLFSYPREKILEEISQALKQGCKEIWITAQDCSCWGMDSSSGLPELLNSIAKIPGKFLVRVGMLNPKNTIKFLPELIESYKSEKIYKFLHLPIQSASNEILEKMNRGYRIEDAEKIISEFRKEFPMIQIWTDVIVGFPNESEAQFKDTLEFLKKVRPDYTNVSRYGVRKNTVAEKMKQLSTEIKKQRSILASELVRKISLEKNRQWIDWQGEVLISERKNNFSGRNFAYKPIAINSEKSILGEFVNAKITDAKGSCLIAKLV